MDGGAADGSDDVWIGIGEFAGELYQGRRVALIVDVRRPCKSVSTARRRMIVAIRSDTNGLMPRTATAGRPGSYLPIMDAAPANKRQSCPCRKASALSKDDKRVEGQTTAPLPGMQRAAVHDLDWLPVVGGGPLLRRSHQVSTPTRASRTLAVLVSEMNWSSPSPTMPVDVRTVGRIRLPADLRLSEFDRWRDGELVRARLPGWFACP